MHVGILRLAFAGFWLFLSVVLLTRHWYMTEEMLERLKSPHVTQGALLALAFAIWNIVRWYFGRRPKPIQQPIILRERKSEKVPEEYNPEFDFSKPPESK